MPATLVRKAKVNNNALQLSWASWSNDAGAEIDPKIVVRDWIISAGGVPEDSPAQVNSAGRIATSRFSAEEFAYCQAWCVIDGENLINATFICDAAPTASELSEVEAMVASAGIVPAPPARPRKWLWF